MGLTTVIVNCQQFPIFIPRIVLYMASQDSASNIINKSLFSILPFLNLMFQKDQQYGFK